MVLQSWDIHTGKLGKRKWNKSREQVRTTTTTKWKYNLEEENEINQENKCEQQQQQSGNTIWRKKVK